MSYKSRLKSLYGQVPTLSDMCIEYYQMSLVKLSDAASVAKLPNQVEGKPRKDIQWNG